MTLAYAEGLAPAEIATRQAVSAGAVRSRLHRAHAMLECDLGTRHDPGQRYAALAAPTVFADAGGTGTLPGIALAGLGATAAAALVGITILLARPEIAPTPVEPLAVAAGTSQTAHTSQPPAGSIPSPDLAVPSTPGSTGPQRSSPNQEHPYWAAVRAARLLVGEVEPQRTAEDVSALDRLAQPMVDPLPALRAPTMTELVRSLAAPIGIRSVVSPDAELIGTRTLMQVEWALQGSPSTTGLLDMLLALTDSKRLGWEVRRGALFVGTWESLASEPTDRLHPIADFLIDPADYLDSMPPEGLGFSIPPGELGNLLGMRLEQGSEVLGVHGGNIHIVACRPVQRVALDYLNGMRRYATPLPEERPFGGEVRIDSHPADGAVIDTVLARGGVGALVPPAGTPLVEHLRAHLASSGIHAVVLRRAKTAPPEDLRISVRAGCLFVHDAEHSAVPSATSVLWADVRPLLEAAADPLGSADVPLSSDPEVVEEQPLDRKRNAVVMLLREKTAPESWDLDPSNRLMVSNRGQLFVSQSPWVVEEFRRLFHILQ